MPATRPFRFKQFQIQQANAAMKVGFDAVLLGAWVTVDGCQRALDVGTGTGVIALMIAQRTNAAVMEAIDKDANAVSDARRNFEESKWKNRLSVTQMCFHRFAETSRPPFDLLVCNPPFHRGEAIRNPSRHLARHASSLPLERFFAGAASVLGSHGKVAIVVPETTNEQARHYAEQCGLWPSRELRVRPVVSKPVSRVLTEFEGTKGAIRSEELAVEVERHRYTEAFRALTREFYLAF